MEFRREVPTGMSSKGGDVRSLPYLSVELCWSARSSVFCFSLSHVRFCVIYSEVFSMSGNSVFLLDNKYIISVSSFSLVNVLLP